jgi:hypothetical protein
VVPHLAAPIVRHHEGDDRHAFPALARLHVHAEVLATLEAEHEAMAQALTETRDVLARYAPLMVPHLESAEWKAAEKQLRRQPPGVAGRFFAWIQDGMDDPERKYLGRTVPTPVRLVLSKVFGRGYHREIAPAWRA